MASRRETIRLLRQGLLPADIAKIRERSISTVTQHIRHQLGEGEVRPVEIILAFKEERGDRLDALFNKHRNHTYRTFEKHAVALGITYEESRLYYDIRQSAALRGDIYVYVSDIELTLHRIVRDTLITTFGNDESGWWRQGVPASVRRACVQSREDDPDPVPDPFCYTTFIHLSDIIDARWALFNQVFRGQGKKQLMDWLRQLNHLRNAVMHPVKRKAWRPAELRALKALHELIRNISSTPNNSLQWTTPAPHSVLPLANA